MESCSWKHAQDWHDNANVQLNSDIPLPMIGAPHASADHTLPSVPAGCSLLQAVSELEKAADAFVVVPSHKLLEGEYGVPWATALSSAY
jgi:hypothetical protein